MRPPFWPAKPARKSPPHRVRPRSLNLHSLEDRLAPAVRTWTGLGADDLWGNAANWDTGVPADGDDVRIPATAESAEVLFDFAVPGSGVTLNSLTGDGTNPVSEPFRITNDTLTLNGPGPFGFGDALTLQGGTIAGSGDFVVGGLLTWNNGTIIGTGTTVAGGGIALDVNAAGALLDGRRLDNNGTATWTNGGNVFFRNGAVFNNAGTFDVRNDKGISNSGAGNVFINAGTFRKSGGAGITGIDVPFTNTGRVDLQTGTTSFNGESTGTGPWAVDAPATLRFGGNGTSTLSAGSTVSGAGTALFARVMMNLADTYSVAHTVLESGTANFDAPSSTTTLRLTGGTLGGAGHFTVSGLLTWNNGSMTGAGTTVADGGIVFDVNPSAAVLDGRRLDNTGTAVWTNAGQGAIFFRNGAVFNNAGTFDVQNNQEIATAGATSAFNNAGTFRKSAGGDITAIDVPVTNTGTIDVRTGTLNLGGGLTNYSADTSTLTGGTYAVAGTLKFRNADIGTNAATITLDGPGAAILNSSTSANALANFAVNDAAGRFTLLGGRNLTTAGVFGNAGAMTIAAGSTFETGGPYTQTAGTTTLDGTLAAPAADIQAGLLEGSGTVNGDMANAAQVSPGRSPGKLTVSGRYTQTSTGNLNVEIGGPNAGSEFDQLVVTGLATLDGVVHVTLPGDFVPVGSDAFRIVSAGSRSGTFATLTGASFPGGQFILLHDGNGTVLDANVAPTPANDSDRTVEGHAVTTGVLANDTDPDGDALTVVAVGTSAQGVTPINSGDGTITYTPPAGFRGTDTFTYTVRDALGNEATATVTIAVTPVNAAPTLDPIPDPAPVPEDSGAQSIDLTGISAGAGDIQSLTVTATSSNPALIPNPAVTYPSPGATGSLHFTPVPNGNGTAVITVTVQDDGGTAFGGVDEVTRTFTVAVTPVPDAPIIDTALIPMLPAVPLIPVPTNPAGARVADLLGGATDPDGDPLGLAVTAIDNRAGKWQFSVNGGTSWAPVPVNVAATAALVLTNDPNTRVRFLPNRAFQGFASFAFRAWDRSDGAIEGTQVDSTIAPTAFSAATERAWVAVGKTNPVVSADGATVLPAVREDSKASQTFLVKSLLGLAGLEQAPATNLGIAITGLDGSGGRWQFRLAGTLSFTDVGAVSESSALLLRPTDAVRFLPNPDADGGTHLTFKTWNQVGTAGTKVDPAAPGFGEDPGSAVLDILAVNDPPVLDLSLGAALRPVSRGETTNEPTVATLLSATDVDGPAAGVAVVAATGSGWQFNTGGGWTPLGAVSSLRALLLNPDAQVRFVAPAGAKPATATLSLKAWDHFPGSGLAGTRVPVRGTAFSKQTEIATVAIGNRLPVLNTAPDVTLPNVAFGVLVRSLLGMAVTDTAGSLRGIAIVSADNANGKWQYSLGGNVFRDVGTVTTGSALLLTDVNKVRFVPNAGFTGPATIQFKAWDRTTGRAGDRIDTGPPLNSFSLDVETATVTVV